MAAVWAITNVDYYLEKDGHQKVVNRVDYTCTQTDEATGISTQHVSFSLPLVVANDNLSNFTEYNDLTEEQLIGWVKAQLTEETASMIEQDLLVELNELLSIEQSASGLPWAS